MYNCRRCTASPRYWNEYSYNMVQHGTTNERGASEIESTQHSTYIRNIPCTHHDTSYLVLPLLYLETALPQLSQLPVLCRSFTNTYKCRTVSVAVSSSAINYCVQRVQASSRIMPITSVRTSWANRGTMEAQLHVACLAWKQKEREKNNDNAPIMKDLWGHAQNWPWFLGPSSLGCLSEAPAIHWRVPEIKCGGTSCQNESRTSTTIKQPQEGLKAWKDSPCSKHFGLVTQASCKWNGQNIYTI